MSLIDDKLDFFITISPFFQMNCRLWRHSFAPDNSLATLRRSLAGTFRIWWFVKHSKNSAVPHLLIIFSFSPLCPPTGICRSSNSTSTLWSCVSVHPPSRYLLIVAPHSLLVKHSLVGPRSYRQLQTLVLQPLHVRDRLTLLDLGVCEYKHPLASTALSDVSVADACSDWSEHGASII